MFQQNGHTTNSKNLAAVKPIQTNGQKHPEVQSIPQKNIQKDAPISKLEEATPSSPKNGFDFTAHMKNIRPSFNKFGQHEPATVRIKNIITQYVGDRDGCGIEELIKELMQNSDDAAASEIHFILDKRQLPTSTVWEEWKPMQGPALCVQNNSTFSQNDIECIQKLGIGSKSVDPDKTGQFGIGFNVVYQLTDCPILLSDHKDICLFDPHLKYVPGACDERPGGHVDLRQDGTFAKLFPDFMSGFLRGHVEHSGCTVFRFPLRTPSAKSLICDMTFSSGDVLAIEEVLQSVDFRMFLHSALLFTKHLKQVKVSVIEDDGKFQTKVVVNRIIPKDKCEQLKQAQVTLSNELKQLTRNQISPQAMTKFSVSYNLITEDEFLKNEWFVNQTFGFHGNLSDKDKAFLTSFYGEESKRFLPVAGVAGKIHNNNITSSLAYSFLPLPIHTGLPAHINSHFAIHSSRRTIWEHTSFGNWNTVLRTYILGPSYCHFLADLGQYLMKSADAKQWIRFLPEASKAKDEYFLKLIQKIYGYMIESGLPVIPVINKNQLGFYPAARCLFCTSIRNEAVEGLCLRLNQKLCTLTDVGLRFKMANAVNICFISPQVILELLRAIQLNLPNPVALTPMLDIKTVYFVLQFLMDGPVSKDYSLLNKVPLSVTVDGVLRYFTHESPVFMDSKYSQLIPNHPELFLHKEIDCLFSNARPSNKHPVRPMVFEDIANVLKTTEDFMDKKWASLFWKYVKDRAPRGDLVNSLAPCKHLPVIPVSNGKLYVLSNGSQMLSVAEASKNMQTVIEALDLPRLDSKLLADEDLTVKDINQLCTPFMLNAALPSAFISALQKYPENHKFSVKVEHAEILLQYLSLDGEYIGNEPEAQCTVRSLPIFEDVDGIYKALENRQGVVLDSCIPTHGITKWMEKSNCILLKEKVAYKDLYKSLSLAKKNAVDVYLDDIFPNFSNFDEELRMSHLTSIRTSVVPLVEAYADNDTVAKFWTKLQSLACIPHKQELLPIGCFKDPEQKVLTLLPGYHMLPLSFSDDVWLPFLRKAGLKQTINGDELIQCAQKVAGLTTAEFAEDKAQLVIDVACTGSFSDDILKQLCAIRFIPQEPVPVDNILLDSCQPATPLDAYISLEKALVYEQDKNRHIFRHSILCWSTENTLPKWVKLSPNIIQIAEIKQQPSVSAVCQHMKNLSDKYPEKSLLSTFKSFRKVISYCLDYLQNPCKCMKKRCEDCASLRSLKDKAFICVKTKHLRVKPTQVILHLPSDIDSDILYPYVFNRPSDMAKYDDLLKHIGAHQVPTADMYADILHALWLDNGSCSPLQTNDKQTASLAVYGLFTTLQQKGQRLTTSPLCLPSDKACMSLSTELIVADNESLVKPLKERGYSYMCSLTSCNLNKPAKELIFYLPEAVRPKLISQLIHEVIVMDEPCDLGDDCEFSNCYSSRIHSEKFKQALWLIAKVPEDKRIQFSNDLGRLKLVEIVCFHVLCSYLSENGRTLENTRTEKVAYVETAVATSKLYVQHCEDYPGHSDLTNEVATAIKTIICYNENYYLDTGAIVELIKCDSDEHINQYLIEKGLNAKEDDMSRPKPGSVVPKEARDMFMYDPAVIFQPKEYVGYLLKTGDQDMIYARVIRETEKTENQELKPVLREYDIDTGRGYPVQAAATDLFKESRRQNLDSSLQLIISDNKMPAGASRHTTVIIEEAKRNVTKLLTEVYSDPTLWKQRDKVKKMLLLKWHPDKSNNSLMATEVFKHLRMEIDRIEEKYKLPDDDENEEATVYEWEEVVDVKTPNSNVREDNSPPKQNVPTGDMVQALRWLQQAEFDYNAAKHLFDNRIGYEWACHICCEIIRKSMVAAIVAYSTITMELESTRFFSKLYDALSRIPGYPNDLAPYLYQLNKLKVDETSTRQLGVHDDNKIPNQVFTFEICSQVMDLTERILTCIKDFINKNMSEN